jgi:DNA-nicking Smr family endonuclease
VARTANPLDKREKPKTPIAPPVKHEPPAPEVKAAIPAFRIGEKASARVAPLPQPAPTLPVMDRKAFTRLKRGKSKPEARIDLHGMTLAEAESVLNGFLLRAHGAGKRLVLVITGKGRARADDDPVPVRTGILRQQVPLWLRRPPLSAIVLDVTEAHQRHGGGGALYVYLRRT